MFFILKNEEEGIVLLNKYTGEISEEVLWGTGVRSEGYTFYAGLPF